MIDNVQATGQVLTSSITGLRSHDIEDISLTNIRITSSGRGELEWAHRRVPEFEHNYPDAFMLGPLPAYGLYCRHVKGLKLRHVEFSLEEADMRPALVCDDVKNLDLDSMTASAPAEGEPVIRLEQVRRAFIRGCSAPRAAKMFLRAEGSSTEQVTIMGNDLSGVAEAISVDASVNRAAIHESGNRLSES